MEKCVVGGKCTQDAFGSTKGLINNLTFGFCESIIDAGGFDKFLDSLDFSVLEECNEDEWTRLRKYLKERKSL